MWASCWDPVFMRSRSQQRKRSVVALITCRSHLRSLFRIMRTRVIHRAILGIKLGFAMSVTVAQSPGDVDLDFGASGIGFAGGLVYKILPLSDGRVLVAGTFTSYDSLPVGHLVRLNADGQ